MVKHVLSTPARQAGALTQRWFGIPYGGRVRQWVGVGGGGACIHLSVSLHLRIAQGYTYT